MGAEDTMVMAAGDTMAEEVTGAVNATTVEGVVEEKAEVVAADSTF